LPAHIINKSQQTLRGHICPPWKHSPEPSWCPRTTNENLTAEKNFPPPAPDLRPQHQCSLSSAPCCSLFAHPEK